MNATDVRDIYRDIESLVPVPPPLKEPIPVSVDPVYSTINIDWNEKKSGVKFVPRERFNLFDGISPWTWFCIAFLSGCWIGIEIISAYLTRSL
ncbi:hypothetical protein [Pseudomonas phage vB_PaeM_PS119XW]|uniref:Uncharacterized protein n=1 Tax=Pseudomonas phage vB_PaeM_PS119XW TaxID=2601632 RepID=A0A5C1K895_9CAUD|nr:hypothetical protein PP933_gp290 [Pseudomonas phage vB_PaeM_PS119XW]QEM42019.1 hypothetical protein [Pseudomonas phage vB_PaeM_PS119XW]